MANPETVFWVDPLANRLVAGWQNNLPAPKPVFKQGDVVPIIIRKVASQYAPYGSMEEIPFSGSVTFTVGNRNSKPLGGYFTISYEDSTSDDIAYDATAEVLETTLNLTPAIALDGGVRVTQLYGDAYKVVFNNTGARTSLSGNGLMLMPQSLVNITTVNAGGSTQQAIFLIVLRQDDYAETADWVTEDTCVASVQQVNAYTWQFGLSKQPKGGAFELSINAETPILLPVNASETEMQLLIGEDYTVQTWGNWNWRIISNDLSPFDITVDDLQVISFAGVMGEVDFSGTSMTEALSSSQTIDAFLGITEEVDETDRVLLNKPAQIVSKVNR